MKVNHWLITGCSLITLSLIIILFNVFNEKQSQELINPPSTRNDIRVAGTTESRALRAYTGRASYYTNDYCLKYNPACKTANGERFDDSKFTIACGKEIKLGSYVKITHEDKSVVAKCNDRGKFSEKYSRVADLSKATFGALAPLSKGVIQVSIELID